MSQTVVVVALTLVMVGGLVARFTIGCDDE
jgi:hypothetical protein